MELRKVDKSNIWKIIHLSVSIEQEDFVATNTESILEAYTVITSGGTALPFGIYENEELVGFVMIGYGLVDEEDPKIAEGNYCLWRFMIDKKYQHRGYGRRALEIILEYLDTRPAGDAKLCWLSYEPENIGARTLYQKMGFVENGEMCDGEIVAIRSLD